ncbi:MAG: methyltransferase [Nannocystaceae bacterium]
MSAPWLRVRALFDRVADAWFALRNRMLSNAAFQTWSTRFPLTRFIARRKASTLFDICAGFVYSQVMQASVRLGLLEAVRDGPRSPEQLAPALGLSLDATQRLLDAASSIELVQRRGGRYILGLQGCSYIGNPALAKMVEHNGIFYRDLADPVALLRGDHPQTELNRFWGYADPSSPAPTGDAVAPYSEFMASTISLLAEDVLEAYPVTKHRRLLDVAGGEGAFVEAVATRVPELALTLFDLPPVAQRAAQRIERAGLSSRVTVSPGDLFADSLPKGADLVSLVRVLHDHDDEQVLRILAAVRQAMQPGGVLLVAEPMSSTAAHPPMGSAYFGFYLLAMGQGRPRTPDELSELLRQSGFVHPKLRGTRRPILTQLISAEVA